MTCSRGTHDLANEDPLDPRGLVKHLSGGYLHRDRIKAQASLQTPSPRAGHFSGLEEEKDSIH